MSQKTELEGRTDSEIFDLLSEMYEDDELSIDGEPENIPELEFLVEYMKIDDIIHEDGETRIELSSTGVGYVHYSGGMDVHIGIENTAERFDGRSIEVEPTATVWFEDEGATAEIRIPAKDEGTFSFLEPSEWHETPYEVERA